MSRGGTPRYARTMASRRSLQSSMTRAETLRKIRLRSTPVQNQGLESRSSRGGVGLEIIKTYLETSGIAGTVGKAGNRGQAIGSMVEDIAKELKKASEKANPAPPPTISKGKAITSAYAVVTNLPPSIYEDMLAAAALHNTWDAISFEWEQSLVEGTYSLVKCVDFGHITTPGNLNLIVGIATDSFDLQKFINDVGDPELRIMPWKTIKGKASWPKPSQNVPMPLKYPTIRQG